MTDDKRTSATELTVDLENLHREEVFTDLRAASVRRLTPVKGDGSTDSGRDVVYIGETNIMTQMGPLPVQFPIEADSLADAFKQFPEGVKAAVERLKGGALDNDLMQRLAEDPAFAKVKTQLPKLLRSGRLVGRAPQQVTEFIRQEVQPALRRAKKIVGKGRAMELILSAKPVNAEEAHRIGLLNKVFPQSELIAETRKAVLGMTRHGPVAIRFALDAVNHGMEMPLSDGLNYEATFFGLLTATDDVKEGMNAFLEKRKAEFTGK